MGKLNCCQVDPAALTPYLLAACEQLHTPWLSVPVWLWHLCAWAQYPSLGTANTFLLTGTTELFL